MVSKAQMMDAQSPLTMTCVKMSVVDQHYQATVFITDYSAMV